MRAVTLSLPFFALCAIFTLSVVRFVRAYEVASRTMPPLPEVIAIRAENQRAAFKQEQLDKGDAYGRQSRYPVNGRVVRYAWGRKTTDRQAYD